MSGGISKLEGARRQLDTAIDLYFAEADSLSIHTLAWASFKVLFDMYPKRRKDDFAAGLKEIITNENWRSMNGIANFLKHADNDPDAFLEHHHPQQALAIIGLSTLLYRRLAGEFSVRMVALDSWVELTAADELGIPEKDANPERAAKNKRMREEINALPYEEYIKRAARHYRYVLEHYERLKQIVDNAQSQGKTLQDVLDEQLG